MRDVDLYLKRIQIRNHNAFALRASLHGAKIPFKKIGRKIEERLLSKEQDTLVDSAMNEAIARKQREFAQRGQSGNSNLGKK